MAEPITYADETITLEASPVRETLRVGVQRLQAREAAMKQEYPNGSEWYFACYVYVDLTAATPTGKFIVEGVEQPWPPTYEDVVSRIPSKPIDLWLARVYELNPDWKVEFKASGETQEKKDETQPATAP